MKDTPKLKYNIEPAAYFMALSVLRNIRDWHENDDLSAFNGDPEKQFTILFEKFKEIIISSGLYNKEKTMPSQREAWLNKVSLVEKRYALPRTQPLGNTNSGH